MSMRFQQLTRDVLPEDRPSGKVFTQVACPFPGRTKQAPRQSADINTIIDRYKRTGLVENVSRARQVFADVSGIGSYHESLNKIKAAEEAFMDLPAKVRSRFRNDPAELFAFLGDEKNRPEAVSLGLVVKPPTTAQVVPPLPPVAGKEGGPPPSA